MGLTHTEARIYMVLLCLKSATAREVHCESNIARQDVYRILSNLEDKGLIDKVLAKPAKFRPIPANEAILLLAQRRIKKNRQLRKKARKAFKNFEAECVATAPLKKTANFMLLSSSETSPTGHIDKPGKAVDSAKKSVMGLITFELFMKVKLMHEQVWKEALKRGVKFKFTISKRSNKELELNLDPMLQNTDHFEIRWIQTPLQATVLLVDEEEVFCRTGISIENPVLWSADPNFVALIKDYLKTKWKSL